MRQKFCLLTILTQHSETFVFEICFEIARSLLKAVN